MIREISKPAWMLMENRSAPDSPDCYGANDDITAQTFCVISVKSATREFERSISIFCDFRDSLVGLRAAICVLRADGSWSLTFFVSHKTLAYKHMQLSMFFVLIEAA
jgi:hypothetical protein